jgi:DsbC/DsbD-like thiol-disulfide interchange protein
MTRTPLTIGRHFRLRMVLPALALMALGTLPSARARADAATHEIRKTEPKVAAGGQASAGLTIAAKNGWHVNPEAPITVSLTSGDAALTVAKPKLTRADLAESTQEKARFDAAAGPKTINAEAKFVMCQESACKPVKETLALNVEVTAADPPAAKGKAGGKSKTRTK